MVWTNRLVQTQDSKSGSIHKFCIVGPRILSAPYLLHTAGSLAFTLRIVCNAPAQPLHEKLQMEECKPNFGPSSANFNSQEGFTGLVSDVYEEAPRDAIGL